MDRDEAPGWDAIDAALAPVVGTTEPRHWATGHMLPDQDGLWGISAYPRDGHWLYVTYGLSELFTKVSDVPDVSGWGEELTMRVAGPTEGDPPEWPVLLLDRLGQLVFERATPFTPGGRIEVDGADGGAPPALCWAEDPELAPMSTPFGSVDFVATLGISRGTLARMREATTAGVLDEIRRANPLLVSGRDGLDW